MGVTIRDVARAAGTSAATVSKVLNGSPTISQETSERVLRLVKEMRYQPNARAQQFARQRTRLVYFLAKLGRDTAFTNPHLYEILSGVQQAVDERGYTLCVKGLPGSTEACGFVERLAAQKAADGVIVHASVVSKRLAKVLPETKLAHLLIGQPNFETALSWVDTNNLLCGELAARHLLSLGMTDIAFIGGKPDDMISWHRLRGVRQAMEGQSRLLGPGRVRQADSTYQDGYRITRQLVRADAPPRAIICANNLIALGCVQALSDRKLRIPQDVAIVTFDTYPFSNITDPMLTVVDINMFDMGLQAGGWIIDKIRKPGQQIQAFTTLPELIVRGSTQIDA